MVNQVGVSFVRLRSVVFFSLITALFAVFLYLISPFAYPIFWAAIIAMVFFPVYKKLLSTLKSPGASSALSLVLVVIVVIFPLVVLGFLLVQQSIEIYQSFSKENVIGAARYLSEWASGTFLAPYVEDVRLRWSEYAANAAQTIGSFLFVNLRILTQNSAQFIFKIFIMLFCLYFFFKDGEKIVKKIIYLSPLGRGFEERLIGRFRSTSLASIKSTFIVGGVQGFLATILFLVTGVPGAIIWGLITVAVSIVPAAGSALVWFPAGVIMLFTGRIWQGIMIILVGGLVISVIDNFLRPPLVGKGAEMHPLIVLLTTLGGIFVFGISGFVIGPVLAALFFSVLSIYDEFYKTELSLD